MNPQDPLAALAPLREPEAISWWPLAPGWYALLALALVIVAAALWLWWRHRQRNAYRRAALQNLRELEHQLTVDGNAQQYLAGVNRLLKRVAIHTYGKRQVAALHGADWLAFLNTSAAQPAFADPPENPYSNTQPDTTQVRRFGRAAAHWLQHHEVSA